MKSILNISIQILYKTVPYVIVVSGTCTPGHTIKDNIRLDTSAVVYLCNTNIYVYMKAYEETASRGHHRRLKSRLLLYNMKYYYYHAE